MTSRTHLQALELALIELEYATFDFTHTRKPNKGAHILRMLVIVSLRANRALFRYISTPQ